MNDYELHREEWIAERAGMLMDSNPLMSIKTADFLAAALWDAEEASKTAQGTTNDLD